MQQQQQQFPFKKFQKNHEKPQKLRNPKLEGKLEVKNPPRPSSKSGEEDDPWASYEILWNSKG